MPEPLVISTPNPSYIALGAQLLRIASFIAVGAGFTWAANISDGQLTMIASTVIGFGTLVWSVWRTFAASRREHVIAEINRDTVSGPAVQPAKVPV
jgi:hypothetical protein